MTCFRGLVHVVLFESLKRNTLPVLRDMIEFLNIRNNFATGETESETRFKCLESHLSGKFKREKSEAVRAVEEDVFNRVGMKEVIREQIAHVNVLLSKATGGKIELDYLRQYRQNL